jgi:hypothetical protein
MSLPPAGALVSIRTEDPAGRSVRILRADETAPPERLTIKAEVDSR